MTLPTFSAGDSSGLADKLQDITRHLQGQSGKTDAYHFRSASGENFLITLSDNAGARKFSIRDSDLVEVFSVDSDGTLISAVNPTTFVFPTSTSPDQTTAGQAIWDSDGNFLTVGTGSGRVRLGAIELVGALNVDQTTTSTSAVDLATITLSRSVAANEPLLITGQYRKSAGAANEASLGLKLNSTIVVTASAATTALARTSATDQAEDGSFEVFIGPRIANYLNALYGTYHTKVSASGAAAQAITLGPTGLAANLITDAITSVTIRGIVGNASVTLGVNDVYVYAFQRIGV